MAALFTPNRSLINPKFDGYKLDPVKQDEIILKFPLPHKLSQVAPSSKSPLSFPEVQSRIRHNHLCIGPTGKAVYVDSDLKVIELGLGEVSLIS